LNSECKIFDISQRENRSYSKSVRIGPENIQPVFMQIYHSRYAIRDSLRVLADGCLFGAEFIGPKSPKSIKAKKGKGETL